MSYVTVPASIMEALLSGVHPWQSQHAKQRGFTSDDSPLKAALCSRRAGKTHGVGLEALETMERFPGERSAYITLTRAKARQIFWDDTLYPLKRAWRLPIELKTRDGHLMVEHPNGASVWVAGCPHAAEVEKFIGHKFRRVFVDEAQAFPPFINRLIDHAIMPTLLDYGGHLVMTGTPGPIGTGFFFDVTNDRVPGWSVHKWDLTENRFLLQLRGWDDLLPDEIFEFVAKERGLDVSSATFTREYRGIWCDDVGALVYPFSREKNGWVPGYDKNGSPLQDPGPFGLPPGDYLYGLGVDLGFSENSTAFCLVAARVGAQELYILEAYKRSRMTALQIGAQVDSVRARVDSETRGEGLTVVLDEGALGAGYAQQMRDMGTACEAAEKTGKRAFQDWTQGLIKSGNVMLHYSKCGDLEDEAIRLPFDEATGREDSNYVNHACDAFLYICRRLMPRYDPTHEEPEYGSREWHEREQKQYRERLIQQSARRKRGHLGQSDSRQIWLPRAA